MKVIGRILYAFAMVVVFWAFIDYARGLMTAKHYEEVGIPPLLLEEPVYDYYYQSVPNYYYDQALIEVDKGDYRVRAYEIAKANHVNQENFEIGTYTYLIIHNQKQTFDLDAYYLKINDEIKLRLAFFRSNRNILIAVNDSSEVYVDISVLLKDLSNVTLEDSDGQVIETLALFLKYQPRMADEITTYYEDHDHVLPTTELNSRGYYQNKVHTLEDYMYIFYIALATYVAFLVIATYFVFFFKKRKLGKQEPSLPFKKYEENKKLKTQSFKDFGENAEVEKPNLDSQTG